MKLPPPLSWFYEAWMEFAHVLGRIMSFIILTILWLVGFGIYAVILKISNAFSGTKPPPASYWIDVPALSPEHLKRQF